MAQQDFNQIFNQLIPMLLQAKQQGITNQRRDQALALQAKQQATAGRQRERQLDLQEDQALRREKQQKQQYMNQAYDGLTWREKKVWLTSGRHIPYGLNPIAEMQMVQKNIDIEDRDAFMTQQRQDMHLELSEAQLADFKRQEYLRGLPLQERNLVEKLEGLNIFLAQAAQDPLRLVIPEEQVEQMENLRSETQKQLEFLQTPGNQFEDILNLFDDKDASLPVSDEDVSRVKLLPLTGKTQKAQFDMVRSAIGDPDLSDADVKKIIKARGASQIGDIFRGLEAVGTETGKFTPSIFPSRQTGIQKLLQ